MKMQEEALFDSNWQCNSFKVCKVSLFIGGKEGRRKEAQLHKYICLLASFFRLVLR